MLPTPFRASVAALLLLVQALGLAHLAAAEHALGDGGAVVEAAPLATDLHEEAGDHLCAGEQRHLAGAAEDCVVLAGWAAPSLIAPAAFGVPTRFPQHALLSWSHPVAPQLEVLARAPKGSPPRG